MELNPNATGFIPFSGANSTAAASSQLKQPEKPPEGASPEVFQKFKEDLLKYVQAIKAEKERLARENEEEKKKQQQQQQRQNYVVETVYADEVGYEDDMYNQDEQDLFGDFGDDGNDEVDGAGGEEEEFIDDLQTVDDKDLQPASQFEGKDLSADELFRIAKTARNNKHGESDFFGVEAELVARTGYDKHAHRDSFNRTVLHFAAEGGNAAIVSRLRKELGEAFVCAHDDKGLLPWHIAVLARQVDCAKLLTPAAGAQGISSPDELEQESLFCKMLAHFSPKTATPALAFGAKPPTLIGETHKVWGHANAESLAGTIPKVRTQSIPCVSLDPFDINTVTAYEEIVTNFGNNYRKQPGGLFLLSWAQPLTSTEFSSRDKFTHLVAAFDSESNMFSGCAVFSALGMLAGPKVPPSLQGLDNYCVSSLAVARNAPASTVHAIMLQSHVDYKGTNVFVRTAAKLPMGAPVAQCKWMYRILRPWNVLASPSPSPLRSFVAGDYEKFASTSMIDIILRQAVGTSFPVPSKELESWDALAAGCGAILAESDAGQMADCVNRVVNSESAFGVHWNGMIVKAIAAATDLRFVLRRGGPNGAVSDVALFRVVKALKTASTTAAILLGLWCPTVARGRRAVLASALAANLVGADVIFTTNTFGLSNADLTSAFFEDIAGSIEKIYSLSGVDKVSPLPAAPVAGGVYVPFL